MSLMRTSEVEEIFVSLNVMPADFYDAILLIGQEGLDWTHMAQKSDQWLSFLSNVTNLHIPHNYGNFLSSWANTSF
jgi:hypothetical protein